MNPAFVPVQVMAAPAIGEFNWAAGELELTLRGGRVVRFGSGVDTVRLVEIITALEGLPSAALAKEARPC